MNQEPTKKEMDLEKRQVLLLKSRGMSNVAISDKLSIPARAVRNYLKP